MANLRGGPQPINTEMENLIGLNKRPTPLSAGNKELMGQHNQAVPLLTPEARRLIGLNKRPTPLTAENKKLIGLHPGPNLQPHLHEFPWWPKERPAPPPQLPTSPNFRKNNIILTHGDINKKQLELDNTIYKKSLISFRPVRILN